VSKYVDLITFSMREIDSVWLAVVSNREGEIFAVSFSPSREAVLRQIAKYIPRTFEAKRDDSIGYIALEAVGKLFHGEDVEQIPKINLNYATEFQRAVYTMLLRIPRGTVSTYARLAHALGCERGYRAIGRVLASNRHPLLIPCHRIVYSSLEIGGYSLPGLGCRGARQLKRRILTSEGVRFEDKKVLSNYLFGFRH
jgi:AraC family transcriptional regulator of adaptative response/methylated-DNA-[protein]-cysteine methyltransferase